MPHTLDTFCTSRARREDARRAATRAAQQWLTTVAESLDGLVAACDLTGPGAVVVFDGEVLPRDVAEAGSARESLRGVTVASAAGSRTLRAVDADLWFEAVLVWDDLRRAAELNFLAEIPVSLAVDVDLAMVTCWEPFYCAQDGAPEPEFSFGLRDGEAENRSFDTVEDILSAGAAEPGEQEVLDRIHGLLATYDVAVPSRPFDEFDEFDDFDDVEDDEAA